MTTGLASFFYGYEFSQCFDVYDCLMQGQELEFKKERCPANWNEYLRTHMEYVRDRFGSFLAAEDETRWREFKAVREQSATAAGGVRESLKLLKPWGSKDRLPARFSRDDKSIPFFSEIKRSQLERSHIGRDRRRALLDQDIFSRIALALGCPAPVTSFIIPRLKKMNKPTYPPKLEQLPDPDSELFKQFTQQTEEHWHHLSSLRPAKLFVRVDDEQRGPLHDVGDGSPLSIVITLRDRMIEVFALDDQLYSKEAISLGALLPHAHGVFDEVFTEQQEVSWKLANDSRLTFHLRPIPGTETPSALELSIAYDEGFSLRRFFGGRTRTTVNHPQAFRVRELLVGGGALVLVLISFFVVSYRFSRKQLPGVASENQGHVAIVQTLPRDANFPQDKNTAGTVQTNGARPVYKRDSKPPTRDTGPSDSARQRRSGENGKPAVSYSQVRSIYLDPSSVDFPPQLHDELSKQMAENGFASELSRDKADARLRIIALTRSSWAFRLVNDSGRGIRVSTVVADVDKEEEVKRAARQVVEALLQLKSQPSPQ